MEPSFMIVQPNLSRMYLWNLWTTALGNLVAFEVRLNWVPPNLAAFNLWDSKQVTKMPKLKFLPLKGGLRIKMPAS